MSVARALVVEDTETEADAVAAGIQRRGYAVDVARGVGEALRSLANPDWALATLDTTLPAHNLRDVDRQAAKVASGLAGLDIPFICVTPHAPHNLHHDVLLAGPFAYVRKSGAREEWLASVDDEVRRARVIERSLRRLYIQDSLYRQLNADERLRYRQDAYAQARTWVEQYCAENGVECVARSGGQVLWAGDVMELPPRAELEAARDEPRFPVFVFGRRVILRRAESGPAGAVEPSSSADYIVTLGAKVGGRGWPPERISSEGLDAYGELDTGAPFTLVEASRADADRILGEDQIDTDVAIGDSRVFYQRGQATLLLGNPRGCHRAGVSACGLVTRQRFRQTWRNWPDQEGFNALLGRDVLLGLGVEIGLDGARRKTLVRDTNEEFDWVPADEFDDA